MSVRIAMRIEVCDGPKSRSRIQPLIAHVYPEHVLRDVVWRNVVAAPADERVVLVDDAGEVVACAGLLARRGMLDGRPTWIGGISGVMVRPDRQRQGLGRTVMTAAQEVLRARPERSFALLFCEPPAMPFYRVIGWHAFHGEIHAVQPGGVIRYDIMQAMTLGLATSAPGAGAIDLGGLPW